jgi:hypothetical protein
MSPQRELVPHDPSPFREFKGTETVARRYNVRQHAHRRNMRRGDMAGKTAGRGRSQGPSVCGQLSARHSGPFGTALPMDTCPDGGGMIKVAVAHRVQNLT